MLRSKIFDRGRDVMLVYPIIKTTNKRGTPVHVLSEVPVKVYVTTAQDRSSDAELPGQVSARVLKCYARDAPVSSWGRIVYDGEEWDIAIPPRFSAGMSRSTQHVEFTIRSRNKMIATE